MVYNSVNIIYFQVKVEYPLKQGLKQLPKLFLNQCILKVKVEYPLKQGLKQRSN